MSDSSILPPSFFARDPLVCAAELIGCELVHGECSGIIVETEAYHEFGDEACHAFLRSSIRHFAHNNPEGTAYVYLNYGVHWLANVICHDRSTEACGFVLIRALEPVCGIELMKKRRNRDLPKDLCSGPGKLTQALAVNGSFNARSLTQNESFCLRHPENPDKKPELLFDRRVGISKSKNRLWRVLAKDHPCVSVPFGKVK